MGAVSSPVSSSKWNFLPARTISLPLWELLLPFGYLLILLGQWGRCCGHSTPQCPVLPALCLCTWGAQQMCLMLSWAGSQCNHYFTIPGGFEHSTSSLSFLLLLSTLWPHPSIHPYRNLKLEPLPVPRSPWEKNDLIS